MWNIGMWFRFSENGMRSKYERGAERYIFPHFYAGQNSCKTGEGLRFAVHSARKAAESAAEQLGNTARNGCIER